MAIVQQRKNVLGLTLIETVVVLVLAVLILLAVLGIYNRVRASAVVIMDRLQQDRLQTEILQKIAEDIDSLAAPGFEATITFQNKLDAGFRSARLILESSYYNKKNQKSTYEKITWQSSYDPLNDSLGLYRMHEGLNVEDKILEKDPESSSSAGLFIPVAVGLTYFEVKARQGETVLGAWNSNALPKGVRVGLSFQPPGKLSDGSVGVPEEAVFFRTIAIDRTREIPYRFVKKTFDLPEEDPNDFLDDPNAMPEPIDEDIADELMNDPGDNEN